MTEYSARDITLPNGKFVHIYDTRTQAGCKIQYLLTNHSNYVGCMYITCVLGEDLTETFVGGTRI